MLMHLQNAPIYYAKYKKEESKVKALMELINEEGVTQVTSTDKKYVNMRRSVTLEHCFGGKERQEITRRQKIPWWILCSFQERRRNYMKIGKIYLKQQLLKDTFTVKRRQRGPKLRRKLKVNKTYGSVPKKTGIKIYRRTEIDRRDESDTATLMVGKQHIILKNTR